GGDHSVAISSLISSIVRFNTLYNFNPNTHTLLPKSSRNYRIGVIWIDAHAAMNLWKDSSSKKLHCMPISFATGLETSFSWVNKLMGTPELDYNDDIGRLDFKDLYYWGVRELDSS